MNIRVFRVVFPDGGRAYELTTKDHRGSIGSSTVEGLAVNARNKVASELEQSNYVTVDFSPYHNITCPSQLAPRLCEPLSQEEKEVFWRTFNTG